MSTGKTTKPFSKPLLAVVGIVVLLALVLIGAAARRLLSPPAADPTADPAALEMQAAVPDEVVPGENAQASVPETAITAMPMLEILPPHYEMVPGTASTFQVTVGGVQHVHRIDLQIGFYPTVAQVVDADPVTAGTQVNVGGFPANALVQQNEVAADGRILFSAVLPEGQEAQDGGIILYFDLLATAEGDTPLSFMASDFLDAQGNPIDVSFNGGSVHVGPLSVVTEEPTSVPPPATVAPTPVAGCTPPACPSTAACSTYHTVQTGDTMFSIARRYQTTVQAVAAANGVANPSYIRIGQVLCIPTGAAAPAAAPAVPGSYIVQRGDTLYSIARRFGTTVEILAARNNIQPPSYLIHTGQVLIVGP